MADVPVRDITGRAVNATPDQAEAMLEGGKAQALSPEQAQESTNAQANLNYVDQNWGTAGKLGMGLASGLSLGLAPGLMAKAGIVDPGHVHAAELSPWYTAGDIAGMVLPAVATGGEGLLAKGLSLTPAGVMSGAGGIAERVVGGTLGENAGLLGRLALKPAQMASRGAVDGALIGLGHNTGENLLYNKPLAAEALAAMGQGALWGGLIGGGMGVVGTLGDLAVDSASAYAKAKGPGLIAKKLGETSGEGGYESLVGKLKEQGSILEEGGARISDSTEKLANTVTKQKAVYKALRSEVVDALDETAQDVQPNFGRIRARLKSLVAAPRAGTIEIGDSLKAIDDFWGSFHEGKGPSSWNGLIKSRDMYAKGVAGNPLKGEILNALDSEIKTHIASVDPALAEKFGAATTKLDIATRMEANLGKKAADELIRGSGDQSGGLTKGNYVNAGLSFAYGHPLTGAAMLGSKVVKNALAGAVEPAMTKFAYDSLIGAKAAAATSKVKERIGKALQATFSTPSKAASVEAVRRTKSTGNSRKDYETEVSKVENLLSANHQDRVRRYAAQVESQGYPDLAKEIMESNQRASMYLMNNMPPRQGAKQAKSLTKVPISKGLEMKELQFKRLMKVHKDPLSVLDDLEAGKVSRDAVAALKYSFPAIHQEIVSQATRMVYEAKASGKTLPYGKVNQLGLVLDSPIHYSQEPYYISAVQTALTMPAPQGSQPQGQSHTSMPAPLGPQNQAIQSSSFMTPLQKVQLG